MKASELEQWQKQLEDKFPANRYSIQVMQVSILMEIAIQLANLNETLEKTVNAVNRLK